MREFRSPRTQWFSFWRFRRVAVPVVTIALVYATLALLMPDARTHAVASPAIVRLSRPVPQQPVVTILPEQSAVSSVSLREVFSATPLALPPLLRRTVAVERGDTLMDILVRNDVPREDAYAAIRAMAKAAVYNPRELSPAHKITVFFNPASADAPRFDGMSIQKDMVSTVRVDRKEGGRFSAGEKNKELHDETRAFSGSISDSLYISAQNAGLPDGVILDLIKMYSYSVDFQRDIQPGDKFEVMLNVPVTSDGSVVQDRGQIAYAMLTLSGKKMPLYRYQDSRDHVEYYDAKGQGMKKPLMRTPINGARISSRFGLRRHPVLGYSKMHKGLDFAAPQGTPIYAAGDGTVIKKGPYSSYGNYIRIRHRKGLETAYAHMRGYKAGLRSGARVKQGQIIGYVGNTGRSTGPHLHYEVVVAGKQVNPATVKLAGGSALGGKDLQKFKSLVSETERAFRGLVTGNDKVASVQAPETGDLKSEENGKN